MVNIGHSSISENGTINGTPGDSTGKEVCIRSWYDKTWLYVYRPRNSKVANKLVKAMTKACNNNNIGYGQSDRLTLYYELKRLSPKSKVALSNIPKVAKKVNCDCSSLVAVCLLCAGFNVSPSMTTYNEYDEITKTGAFDVYTGNYLKNPNLLKAGDILQSSGHTAIVVADNYTGNTNDIPVVCATQPAYEFDKDIAGSYTVNVRSYLALRHGAGTNYPEITQMYNGQRVYCYGYKTGNWYYVQAEINDVLYTGFCLKDYLV